MSGQYLNGLWVAQHYLDQLVVDAAHYFAKDFCPINWPESDCKQAWDLLKAGPRSKRLDWLVSDISEFVGLPEQAVYQALFKRAHNLGFSIWRRKKAAKRL
jgi:hypothetical protein